MTRYAGVVAAALLGCGEPFAAATVQPPMDSGGEPAIHSASALDASGEGVTANRPADAAAVTAQDAASGNAGVTDGSAGGVMDGAAPVTIGCGASTCDLASSFCCALADGTQTCQASTTTCTATGGARRSCDQASDCPAGEVCCYDFSSTPASASCRADCGGGGDTRLQACRTQAECSSGTCSVHSCTAGGPIESCAPFPPLCP